jgi:hypothetical protein
VLASVTVSGEILFDLAMMSMQRLAISFMVVRRPSGLTQLTAMRVPM